MAQSDNRLHTLIKNLTEDQPNERGTMVIKHKWKPEELAACLDTWYKKIDKLELSLLCGQLIKDGILQPLNPEGFYTLGATELVNARQALYGNVYLERPNVFKTFVLIETIIIVVIGSVGLYFLFHSNTVEQENLELKKQIEANHLKVDSLQNLLKPQKQVTKKPEASGAAKK